MINNLLYPLNEIQPTKNMWFKLLNISIGSVYLYVFLEWIFFVTKPSFMSSMNSLQKIEILLSTSFTLGFPVVILFILISGIWWLFERYITNIGFESIGVLLPSIVCTSLGYILIDNFTYTVFSFGIVSSDGIWRLVYGILYGGLFVVIYKNFLQKLRIPGTIFPPLFYFVLSFTLISTISFTFQSIRHPLFIRNDRMKNSSQFPNIILIGLDGVNAENMSVYGYTRNTTPYLSELTKNALIINNAYSNSGNTGGSLTSLLTGKLPTETRVLYPPDILTGDDAYQHLPGILKQLGYYTAQVTMPHFGDAYTVNIRNGFDIANFRSEENFPLVLKIGSYRGGVGSYFSALIIERIVDRLKHTLYIKQMENPFEIVTNPTTQITEDNRFETVVSLLENSKDPIFIHAHFLGTHGPTFELKEQFFSIGEEQNKSWMVDFYDDAIRALDKIMGDLFDYLINSGKMDNSIIVLYSDHGMNWNSLKRVPLIMWFPNNEYQGYLKGNVQLADIAPTILDYLEITQPTWMDGKSIIDNNIPPDRILISADVSVDLVRNIDGKGWIVDETKSNPPFYQLGVINMIICDRWFSLKLRTPKLTYGEVVGSSSECDHADIPLPEQATELILLRLSEDDYDTSSFPENEQIIQIEVINNQTPISTPSP